MKELGKHIILELFGCDVKALDDLKGIAETMRKSAEEAGARIVGEAFHKFNPQGVSGVVIIAESHISIHTWPEFGYAAVDIFTCSTNVNPSNSTNVNPSKAYKRIIEYFKPKTMSLMEVKRGLLMGDKI
ncbi:MAG: adenosylmethionine decarboxylase [Candidatus Methanomethyliaceae archaeon]|nr:adenosylmethionine decarboxylase [Candidatus Methanomethyliaceae archaeon]MDW7970478.1 adenosylmethionine decarboxylase [Nitrososphaerota archaeon]